MLAFRPCGVVGVSFEADKTFSHGSCGDRESANLRCFQELRDRFHQRVLNAGGDT